MADTNQNVEFEDAENYGVNYMKDKLTFRDIVLSHLRKITQFASVEFRGGYWESKQIPYAGGQAVFTQETYVPDTREVYTNAVECFADLLYPYFDAEMKKAEATSEKEKEKAYKDNTVVKQPDREDENSEEGEEYVRTFESQSDRISYRNEKVRINRRLFRALCSFLYRKKYLELGTIED